MKISFATTLLFLAALARPVWAGEAASTTAAGDGDFSLGPTYTNAPELTVRAGVPRGTIHAFKLSSTDSKIYPGLTTNFTRGVWVYVPSQYVPGTPAPFIIVQDGQGYTNRLANVLDNLINDHRLPVMIAVMINPGPGDGPGSERGLEYDTVSDSYVNFIETEVLPKIAKNYHVAFTKDPEGRATMGGSSGAACAFTMAWFRPDLYRRVLSYSGTFVNQQSPKTPIPRTARGNITSISFPKPTPSLCASGSKWARRTTAGSATKPRCTTGCSRTSTWPPP